MIVRLAPALAALLLVVGPADSQEKQVSWSGIDGWVTLLQQRGVTFLGEADRERVGDDPDVLIVLFGKPPDDPLFPDRVARHVQRKQGSLLVASDLPAMNPVFGKFGAELAPTPYAAKDKRSRHEGYQDCPLVTPEAGFDHLFRGVHRLALNRPAWFRRLRWPIAAFLPEAARLEGRELPCLLTQRHPKVLFLSDHSLFINLMLTEESNLRFVANVLEWFAPRKVLFLCDGRVIRPSGIPGLPPFGSPASIRVLDRALREAEKGGIFRSLGTWPLAALTAGFSLLLGAVLAVWILRGPSQSPDVLARAPALLVDFGGDEAGHSQERNLRLPAQEFLHAWWKRFRARHGLPPGAEADAARWEIRGGSGGRRRAFRRDLAELVAVAARAAEPLGPTGFRHLVEAARRCDEAKDVVVAPPPPRTPGIA